MTERTNSMSMTDKTKDCIVPGCGRKRNTREYCNTHYNVWILGIDPVTRVKQQGGNGFNTKDLKEKECTKCGIVKKRKFFYERTGGFMYPHCKDCHSKMTKVNSERKQAEKDRLKALLPKVTVICSGPQCDRTAAPKSGLCKSHTQQKYKGKELTPLRVPKSKTVSSTEKLCANCNQIKHVRNFYKRSSGNGYQSACRTCMVLANGYNQAMAKNDVEFALEKISMMPEPMKSLYQDRHDDRMSSR